MSVILIILLIGAYLVGAIPFGYVLVRLVFKKDIRTMGSGNPGATNVWRSFGARWGAPTLLLDILKGVVPVLTARSLFPGHQAIHLAAGMAAILGHSWSLFLRGKGGKGVATSAGAFLALLPLQFGIALGAFLVVFLSSRYVSLGSIVAAITLAIATGATGTSGWMKGAVGLISLIVIIKHIPNIKRLVKGTEPKSL